MVNYANIKINKKDRSLQTKTQIKMYYYKFDKRMIHYEIKNLITSLPYGF